MKMINTLMATIMNKTNSILTIINSMITIIYSIDLPRCDDHHQQIGPVVQSSSKSANKNKRKLLALQENAICFFSLNKLFSFVKRTFLIQKYVFVRNNRKKNGCLLAVTGINIRINIFVSVVLVPKKIRDLFQLCKIPGKDFEI